MKLYGSLNNRLSESMTGRPAPTAGIGATEYLWSDRHAYTVTRTERFKSGERKGQVSKIWARRDIADRTDGLGMSDTQSYRFTFDFAATDKEFRVGKDGNFRQYAKGNILGVGSRSEHYDYSF